MPPPAAAMTAAGGGRKVQIKPDDHCRNDCRSGYQGACSSSAPTALSISLSLSYDSETTIPGVWRELPHRLASFFYLTDRLKMQYDCERLD